MHVIFLRLQLTSWKINYYNTNKLLNIQGFRLLGIVIQMKYTKQFFYI